MIPILLWVLAGLVLVWIGMVATAWANQDRIVFQPPNEPFVAAHGAQMVRYRSADGTELFAYAIGTPRADRPVVICFHGNADLARWYVPWGTLLAARTGATVVIPEFRGYDGVPGAPTCEKVAQDARAALDWVLSTARGRPQRLAYFGHSLGTAIAADLAADYAPDVLILQSPFTSPIEIARRMMIPGIAIMWKSLSRVHYDTVARVGALDSPVWVAHGEADRLIPVAMGREVFKAAKNPGELLLVPTARHNDVDETGGEAYWRWMAAALGQKVEREPRSGVSTT